MSTLFHIPERWRIEITQNTLLIIGGADSSYELDITGNENTDFVRISNQTYDHKTLTKNDQVIHEQLVSGGISVPKLRSKKTIKVELYDSDKKLDGTQSKKNLLTDTDAYDLGIIIRSNQTYGELLQSLNYSEIKKPHILIDTANHETISIGPLVFPGETACLACLQGRIEHRWSDTTPPAKPKAHENQTLIKGIIENEISKFSEEDYGLIGKTIALNLSNYTSVEHKLYKVSYCPVCPDLEIDRLQSLT